MAVYTAMDVPFVEQLHARGLCRRNDLCTSAFRGTLQLRFLLADDSMPGRQEATETSKFMADAIGSGVLHSAYMHPELLHFLASLTCLSCCYTCCLMIQPASSFCCWSDMTQPEEWLEELLGFSLDGSRKSDVPCPLYVPVTEGLLGLQLFHGLCASLY